MIKIAVVGFGNVGRAAVDAVLTAEDMELVGIVEKNQEEGSFQGVPIVKDAESLPAFDAAVLALPTRIVPEVAVGFLEKGIYTADSFDIHTKILETRSLLDSAAKKGKVAAVTAAGWDPGTDSVVRVLMEAMAPRGLTNTNFGPGMSMGHSVAAKAVEGVKDALSMTVPVGSGVHRRMVYVQLEQGADINEVRKRILADDYFSHDETHVIEVADVSAIQDIGHGVRIERKGVSGVTHNQKFGFDMSVNNPALTGQILVSALRGALRQQSGCYTLIELPVVDLLPGSREDIISRLV